MTRRPVTSLVLALAAALLLAAAGGAVERAWAATISPQAELRHPARFPVAIPGGYKQGSTIPRGWVLLRRSVALAPGDGRTPVVFRCPGRRLIRNLGLNDPSDIGIEVPSSQRGYDRRSRVRLLAYRFAIPGQAGATLRGRIYVLCRPR